jgi:hypothetical protein
MAGKFAQELPPNFDVPGQREPGERPELVAEGLVVPVCASSTTIGALGHRTDFATCRAVKPW